MQSIAFATVKHFQLDHTRTQETLKQTINAKCLRIGPKMQLFATDIIKDDYFQRLAFCSSSRGPSGSLKRRSVNTSH